MSSDVTDEVTNPDSRVESEEEKNGDSSPELADAQPPTEPPTHADEAQPEETYDTAAFGDPKTTQISYFDPFGVYPELKNDLLSRLPLVNLHWNPPDRPLRSIPSLDVDLVQEHVNKSSHVPHQMLGLSDDPYLKIILIKCEDNDTYRSSVRKLIRDWISKNVLSLRDPAEWLIIHYVPLGGKSYSGNRFRSGVFDKIKADFNSNSKKDRCIQIVKSGRETGSSSEIEKMEIWSDIMTRIKEGVLESFSKRVVVYQKEIEKLEASKDIMGWNFGTFFVMKEALALSFANIKLFDDALLQYDELEQSFVDIMNQNNASFLTSVGFEEEENTFHFLKLGDDRSIRIKIMENNISLFEFHCYLFARQASLLLYISKASSSKSISALKIAELYGRLRSFINEMNGLLVSNRKDNYLIAEWSYNVVRQFLKASDSLPEGIIKEVSQGKGEMLLIIRKSLEVFGIGKGYYIEGVLSDVSIEGKEEDNETSHSLKLVISRNQEIKTILQSPDAFYAKYRELTVAASSEFDLADKIRIVDRLSTQLALLDYQLHDYESAVRIFESIYPLYSRQGWENASSYLLNIFIKCLKEITDNNKSIDNKLMIYSLELLKRNRYLSETEVNVLLTNIDELSSRQSLSNVNEEILDDWLSIHFSPSFIYSNDDSHGTYIISCLTKCLFKSQTISFDYATVNLINDRNEKLSFRVETPTIPFDKQVKLEFLSTRFIYGSFAVENVKFFKKKLSLVKQFTTNNPIEFYFHPSPDILWAELKLANSFNLSQRNICLTVHIKHDVKLLKVRLKPENHQIKLNLGSGVVYVGEDIFPSKFMQPSLTIENIKSNSTLHINIPFTSESEEVSIPIKVTIDYTTSQNSFQHSFANTLDLDLAIDVNVFDFFRSKKLFSRFSIFCKVPAQPVRIEQVSLTDSSHYDTCTPKLPGPITAFPGNPVSFAFGISRKDDSTSNAPNDELTLSIRHRYLRDGRFMPPAAGLCPDPLPAFGGSAYTNRHRMRRDLVEWIE